MRVRNFTIHESAAEAASFNGDMVEVSAPEILVGIDVTVVSGTNPTMDVEIEWSIDGTTWVSAGTAQNFTQFTAAGAEVLRFDAQARFYRLAVTIAGTDTPTFTFLARGTHFDRN